MATAATQVQTTRCIAPSPSDGTGTREGWGRPTPLREGKAGLAEVEASVLSSVGTSFLGVAGREWQQMEDSSQYTPGQWPQPTQTQPCLQTSHQVL